MTSRKASIKETGEELSQEDWKRFEKAVADEEAQPKDDVARAPKAPDQKRRVRRPKPN